MLIDIGSYFEIGSLVPKGVVGTLVTVEEKMLFDEL